MEFDTLDALRGQAAQAEFEEFVFDAGCEPEASDGWERAAPGNEWTKVLYFPPQDGGADPDEDGEDAPTVKGSFTVVFEEGSADVREAWASLGGSDVGRRASVAAPSA